MCCGPDQQEVGELVSALSDLSVNRLRQRGTCQIFIFRFSCFYCSVFLVLLVFLSSLLNKKLCHVQVDRYDELFQTKVADVKVRW